MTTHPQDHVAAIWKPGWYRLDQSIEVGQKARFWFHHPKASQNFDGYLTFFNTTSSVENVSQVREARVFAIEHPEFGLIKRIDTDGLDYVFVTIDGREFIVNAEEDPGMIYDDDLEITGWKFTVTLTEVSDPLSELV